MAESVMAEKVHTSHKMGVDFNDTELYDLCTVCYECACHSPEALLTPCDDISWLINSTTE